MLPEQPLILAFDTAAAHCAAALLLGDRVLAQSTIPMKTGQAEYLLPMLEKLLHGADKTWQQLSALAVGIGPGNFTGVRLGVSAARGLALGLGIPAIGINALEMRAPDKGAALVALPSGRDRFFVQIFDDGKASAAPYLAGTLPHDPARVLILDAPINLVRMAQLATARLAHTHGAPAPLYLRAADAAPSSDPAPRLLDVG